MSDDDDKKAPVTPIHRGLRSAPPPRAGDRIDTGPVDLPDWVTAASEVGRGEKTAAKLLTAALQRSLEERYPWPEGITVKFGEDFADLDATPFAPEDLPEGLAKALEVRGQDQNAVVEIHRNGVLVKSRLTQRLHVGQDYGPPVGERDEDAAADAIRSAPRIFMGGSTAATGAPFPKVFRDEPEPMRADKPWVRRLVLAGVVFIGIAAFAISFGAIYDVAGWTGWAPWQQILTPLLFDAGIVVFTFLSFIRLERGDAAWTTFLLAEALTVASSIIQVIHTLDTSPMEPSSIELYVACVIAAMPPLILSASSYLTGRTIFRKRVTS